MSSVLAYLKFERRSSDNPWLDLARALAILLVLLRHGQRAIDPQLQNTPSLLGTFFLNGWIGVDLFFVLSGYLITSHLIKAHTATGSIDIRSYFAGRALRIVPAYFATLALIVAGAFPLYHIAGDHLGLRIAYHMAFLQDYLPSNFNIAFWSLGVEEKFYLAAPILVWVCLSQRRLWQKMTVVAVLGILSITLRAVVFARMPDTISYDMFFAFLRSPFHLCLESLAAGVAVALLNADRKRPFDRKLGKASMASAAVALLLWIPSEDFMSSIVWRDVLIQPLLLAGLFALFVNGAVLMTKVSLPFEPFVRVAARLSYTLYLVHIPLIPLSLLITGIDGGLASFWTAYVLL
jgi:peptidoglycan/LPS O-acetylase OafA/YrhL